MTTDTMWDPELDPGTENDISGKTGENLNKVYSLVTSIVPMSIS